MKTFIVGLLLSVATAANAQVGPNLKFTNTVSLKLAVNTDHTIYVPKSGVLDLSSSYTTLIRMPWRMGWGPGWMSAH